MSRPGIKQRLKHSADCGVHNPDAATVHSQSPFFKSSSEASCASPPVSGYWKLICSVSRCACCSRRASARATMDAAHEQLYEERPRAGARKGHADERNQKGHNRPRVPAFRNPHIDALTFAPSQRRQLEISRTVDSAAAPGFTGQPRTARQSPGATNAWLRFLCVILTSPPSRFITLYPPRRFVIAASGPKHSRIISGVMVLHLGFMQSSPVLRRDRRAASAIKHACLRCCRDIQTKTIRKTCFRLSPHARQRQRFRLKYRK